MLMDVFVFIILVLFILIYDLIFCSKNKDATFKKSLLLSFLYIFLAFVFCGYIAYQQGSEKAQLFLTAYLVEKSLSIDNIFVIAIIFQQYFIPEAYQKRILVWGILGAIMLRAILIYLGVAIVEQFSWVLYFFSVFLFYTGIKLLFNKSDEHQQIKENRFMPYLKKIITFTKDIKGNEFFIKTNDPKSKVFFIKNYAATPLFRALIIVEFSDLVFALDSIPAVFSITTDVFIVYTSNIFAIIGLRSLYFVLHKMITVFKNLKYSLSILLIFIGSKGIVKDLFGMEHLDHKIVLMIIVLILMAGMIPYDRFFTKRKS
jgi:tellurite resistance protein TerC